MMDEEGLAVAAEAHGSIEVCVEPFVHPWLNNHMTTHVMTKNTRFCVVFVSPLQLCARFLRGRLRMRILAAHSVEIRLKFS